jgi:hypothetical protein
VGEKRYEDQKQYILDEYERAIRQIGDEFVRAFNFVTLRRKDKKPDETVKECQYFVIDHDCLADCDADQMVGCIDLKRSIFLYAAKNFQTYVKDYVDIVISHPVRSAEAALKSFDNYVNDKNIEEMCEDAFKAMESLPDIASISNLINKLKDAVETGDRTGMEDYFNDDNQDSNGDFKMRDLIDDEKLNKIAENIKKRRQ